MKFNIQNVSVLNAKQLKHALSSCCLCRVKLDHIDKQMLVYVECELNMIERWDEIMNNLNR